MRGAIIDKSILLLKVLDGSALIPSINGVSQINTAMMRICTKSEIIPGAYHDLRTQQESIVIRQLDTDKKQP